MEEIASVDVAEIEVTPDHGLWRLAERLHWAMTSFDPSPDDLEWTELSAREREFYRCCVNRLLEDREVVSRLIQ